jgi:hypothetical protein
MRELKAHLKEEIKVQANKQQQKEDQINFFGRIKPKRGQSIFEINTKTGEILQAKFINTTVNYVQAVKGDFSGLNEVLVKEDCIYIPAINEANALRKFKQNPNQEAYFIKEAIFSFSDLKLQ